MTRPSLQKKTPKSENQSALYYNRFFDSVKWKNKIFFLRFLALTNNNSVV